MNIKSILNQAKEEGWHVSEEYIEERLEESGSNIHSLSKHLLNQDLKDIGLPSLTNDLTKGKSNQLSTPIILQVSNVRNVSAPKANEESGAAPRLLKITLTDGISYIHGIEVQPIKSLSLKTAPGTKVKLVSKVPMLGGFLLLTTANIIVLEGEVEDLYKKWLMSQSASKYSRNTASTDGSGPPSWVPFGQKILVRNNANFKALNNDAANEKDDEFESQRKQVVQEISQGSSQKVFGGGKQMLDSSVQKVVNAGFSIQEAEWALRRNKNDAYRAIQDLRGNSGGNCSDSTPKLQEEPNKRGTRGRGRGSKGRGRGGPDDSDEDDYVAVSSSSRPSGPASLLDYFESKILDKKDQSNFPNDEYSNNSRQFSRGRGRGNMGRRGTKKERGKPVPKSEGENIMSENWPSLQKNVEPEPARTRELSPNIYGRDDPLDESQYYEEDIYQVDKTKSRSWNRGNESQSFHYNNYRYKENYGHGNFNETKNHQRKEYTDKNDTQSWAKQSQNYQGSEYRDNKLRYESGYQNHESNSYKNNIYRDKKPMAYFNDDPQRKNEYGRNKDNPPSPYENSKLPVNYQKASGYQGETSGRAGYQGATTGRAGYQGETSDRSGYQGETSGRSGYQGETSGRSGYQGETSGRSGYQGETSGRSGYQGETSDRFNYRGETSGKSGYQNEISGRSGYQNETFGRSGQQGETSGGSAYQGEASGRSYQGETSVRSGYQGDSSERYRRPDQPIFMHSRGRQNYNRNQEFNLRGSGNPNNFQRNYPEEQESARKDPKDRSVKERELIAQFEKSMVMAGCYEPYDNNRSNFKGSFKSNNYNYEGDRPPSYDDHQSQEFQGSIEYHRGGGFVQRSGGRPRYGRNLRY